MSCSGDLPVFSEQHHHFRESRCYCLIMKSSSILRATTLLAAAVSLVLSVWLYFQNDASVDDRLNGIFVGVWVPSILALGNFLISSDSDRKG